MYLNIPFLLVFLPSLSLSLSRSSHSLSLSLSLSRVVRVSSSLKVLTKRGEEEKDRNEVMMKGSSAVCGQRAQNSSSYHKNDDEWCVCAWVLINNECVGDYSIEELLLRQRQKGAGGWGDAGDEEREEERAMPHSLFSANFCYAPGHEAIHSTPVLSMKFKKKAGERNKVYEKIICERLHPRNFPDHVRSSSFSF